MVLVKVSVAGVGFNAWDLKGHTKIVQILVSSAPYCLKSLQFTFLQDDGNLHSPGIVGCPNLTGDLLNVFTFEGGGEYVTQVEGLYSSVGGTIGKLSIHTNIKVYNLFVAGDLTNSRKFSFNFGGLNQFGGFHGGCNGDKICGIGVYFNQLQALPPNFKRSPATSLIKH